MTKSRPPFRDSVRVSSSRPPAMTGGTGLACDETGLACDE